MIIKAGGLLVRISDGQWVIIYNAITYVGIAITKAGSELQRVNLVELDIITFVEETVQSFDPFLQSRHVRKRLYPHRPQHERISQ
jgi:hypothetical protein